MGELKKRLREGVNENQDRFNEIKEMAEEAIREAEENNTWGGIMGVDDDDLEIIAESLEQSGSGLFWIEDRETGNDDAGKNNVFTEDIAIDIGESLESSWEDFRDFVDSDEENEEWKILDELTRQMIEEW